MPIIPQYRAQGPAGPQAPVMEQERGPRVDASEAVQGVARLAGVVQGVQMGQLDPNLGQRSAQGLQAIGQGVGDVGSALFDISQRVAEAKNYADEHDAQLAMDREVGEFEKWRIQNPDPTGWEPAWKERMGRFGGQYFAGKNLAPVAQEAIKQRLGTFTERRAIQVGVDAMRESVGRATSAGMAQYMRAIEAGNAPEAVGTADDMFRRGWIPEDQAERMKIQARDQVESKQIEMLQNQKETFLLYRDKEGALAVVDQMPIREDEKALARAEITERYGYSLTLDEVEDIADPRERIKAIESGKYSNLRTSDKEKFLNQSYQQINQGNADTVEAIKDGISRGQNLRDISMTDAFKSLPESSQLAIADFAVNGAKDDVSEYLTALRAGQGYDPTKDPRGDELAAMQQAATLRFKGERSKAILSTLEDSSQRTEPQQAIEKVETDYLSHLQRRYDNGDFGDFRVTGADIIKEEDENGAVSYYVNDEKGDIPAVSVPWGRDKPQRRKITLTEEDRLKFDSTPSEKKAKMPFEDQSAKEAAFGKFLATQEEIVRRRKAGEITNADEMAAAGAALLGGEIRTAAARNLQPADAPTNSFGRPDGALYKKGAMGAKTSAEYESEIDAKLKAWEEKANGN